MSDITYQGIAIGVYFALMLAIGYVAYTRTRNIDGYMLAERGLHPAVAALSANAADMSGWLLMGLPGAIYASGLIESWIAIGLTIGAWLNWKFVAPRLRAYTEIAGDSITIPSFFERRLRDRSHLLRIVSALVILVFFTFYVSSGMVAAGKFFESSFGWTYLHGVMLVAAITLVYTLFGGFLGATLTDVAQGLLMFTALVAVPIVAVTKIGSPGEIASQARDVNPDVFNLFAGDGGAGLVLLGIISTAAWGLGYFGQPHIIVRFMALRTPADAHYGRIVSTTWMIITAVGTILTALIGVAYFANDPAKEINDPETVFLLLSQIFFHPLVAGFVLAAVLAAVMSTMSSQLIVCSSALVEDLVNLAGRKASAKALLMYGRLAVLAVALVGFVLALDPNSAILELVAFAWAGFGGAFGPIVILSLYWRKLTATGALTGMIVGAVTVFVWGNVDVLTSHMYEIVPGFLANLVVAVLVSKLWPGTAEGVDEEFGRMESELQRKETAPTA